MPTVQLSVMPHNLTCWEEGASCDDCLEVLRENQTMIFSVADSSVMAGVAIIFSFLGFAFNLITITALLFYRSVRQQITTPFILSVSFAHLLYSTIILPLLATRFYTRQSESAAWTGLCKVFPVLFYLVLGASILSLMSVTINRTCILLFQEKAQNICNVKVRNVVIFLCWLLPLAILTPSTFGQYGQVELNDYTQSCTIGPDDNGRNPKRLMYNLFVFLPCTIMVICNIIIFAKLKFVPNSESVSENRKAENIFILMLFMVFLFFVLTLFPSWAVDHFDKCYKHPTIHAIAYMLNWTGVIINPIIFMVTQRSYREAVRGLFKKLFVEVKNKDAMESTVMHLDDFVKEDSNSS
eukprot:GFUD01028114.1.p1 GENE.GFUD01028114.1~~GFUD01028114.1.p1  ORF type:complete len:353 (+),score=72.37 GFUD01028114.1:101-1159(+)